MTEYCCMCDELVSENPGVLLVNPEYFAKQLEVEHTIGHPIWNSFIRSMNETLEKE